MDRREFVIGMGSVFLMAGAGPSSLPRRRGQSEMYGRIGRIVAVAGSRDTLAEVLLEGTRGMPGCLSYVVARDQADPDALWVTEVWESEAAHRASLALPEVQAAIERGRPMISAFGEAFETEPLGGQGLPGV